MEYETARAMIEMEIEEAKSLALEEHEKCDFVVETPDPLWAQPADTAKLQGTDIDDAQGFWINDGKQCGTCDKPCGIGVFDHDLPNLPKKPVKLYAVRRSPTCYVLWSS